MCNTGFLLRADFYHLRLISMKSSLSLIHLRGNCVDVKAHKFLPEVEKKAIYDSA